MRIFFALFSTIYNNKGIEILRIKMSNFDKKNIKSIINEEVKKLLNFNNEILKTKNNNNSLNQTETKVFNAIKQLTLEKISKQPNKYGFQKLY
jgi:predicted transcriptional regulator